MRSQPNATKNTTAEIICRTPWRLVEVIPIKNYKLEVCFIDGVRGYVEMENLITSVNAGVFAKLKNIKLFNQVYLEHGVVTWPGEIDLAPDVMHQAIKRDGVFKL